MSTSSVQALGQVSGVVRPRTGYVRSLDGVRAFAVMAVVATHANLPAKGGKVGVLIFFVLSGYLISSILLRERGESGDLSLRRFYVRRARRLLPAMLVATLAYAVLAFAPHWAGGTWADTWRAIPSAVFYCLNWYGIAIEGHRGVGPFAHYWSLSVEEQFYLLWPVLIVASYAYRGVRGVLTVATVGVVLSYGAKWLFVADGTRQTGTDLSADALLAGCALACAIKLRPTAVQHFGRLTVWPATALLLMAWVLGDSTPTAGRAGDASFTRMWWPVAIVGSLSVLAACVTGTLPTVMARVLEWPPIVYLGVISYGIYLWHVAPLQLMSTVRPMVRFPVAATVAVAIAAASYRWVESPFLRQGRPHNQPISQ